MMNNPLSSLKDIHTPEAISAWPPAPGWIILVVLILTLSITLLYFIKKHHNHYKVKHHGLKTLQLISESSSTHYAQRYNALLKRVAYHYFPDENIKTLSGENWIHFLVSKLPKKHQEFATVQASHLIANLYRPTSIDIKLLKQFIQLWIKECR